MCSTPEIAPQTHDIAQNLRNEWVLQVKGTVSPRPEGTENPRIPTGEVEVIAREISILNPSRVPPFGIEDEAPEADELVRMKFRQLDLRRAALRDNLLLRHNVVKFIRDYLSERDFIEVETPILTKSTPEGARGLPCAKQGASRQLLRPAPVAAADEAASGPWAAWSVTSR